MALQPTDITEKLCVRAGSFPLQKNEGEPLSKKLNYLHNVETDSRAGKIHSPCSL
uniref:Uncharacterized protein n=1 Tax=Anguilla anguilla TaxID=7936 RepID=A0A0E9PKS6_ANGAN